MADFACRTEIPTIVEIDDVDHVRFVRAFNTTWSAKSDRDGIPSYFRRQWRPRLYRPCRARVWSRVSSWVDFSSPITITHFPPRLCNRNSPFSWTREISRVFSARTQESEECRALIYTTVREVFAVELPATLLSAFATSCKTTSASFELLLHNLSHLRSSVMALESKIFSLREFLLSSLD